MFDLNGMMGKVKEAQEQMKKTQEELAKLVEHAESGAGMVKASVNGKREVLSIEIDSSILNLEDKKLVEDLTVAAINLALRKIDEKSQGMMQNNLLNGLPNIPGLDLNNFKF